MMAIGEYPRVSLKEAREAHFEARKVLASGVDPMSERKAAVETRQAKDRASARSRDELPKCAQKWWEWWSVGKSPRHADTVMRRLKADLFSRVRAQVRRWRNGRRRT